MNLKLTCVNCGFRWKATDESIYWKILESRKSNKEGPFCLSCIYLEMARRIAHLRGMSLRRALFIFLRATARKEGRSFTRVWKEKEL